MNLFKLSDFSDPAKQQAITAFAAKKFGRQVDPARIGVIARSAKDLEVVNLDEYESAGGLLKTFGSQLLGGVPSTVAGAAAFPVGAGAGAAVGLPTTGPGGFATSLIGGTAAATGAGALADAATMKVLETVAPSARRELENQRLINPTTSTLGQIASGFGLAKNALSRTGIKEAIAKRLGKDAAEVTGKDAAKIIGMEAGVNVGAEAGTELVMEGDLDPVRLGLAGLAAPAQLKQTRLGEMVTGAGEKLAGRLYGPRAVSNPELPNEQALPIPDHAAERNAAVDEFLAAGNVDQPTARGYYERILGRSLPEGAEINVPGLRATAENMVFQRQQADPEWRASEAGKAYDALQTGVGAEALPNYPWLTKLAGEYKKAPALLSREQFVAAARNENPMAGVQRARSENLPLASRMAELQGEVRSQVEQANKTREQLEAEAKARRSAQMLATKDEKRAQLLELKKRREIDAAYAERNKQLASEASERGDEFRAMVAAREAENLATQKQLEQEIAAFEANQDVVNQQRVSAQLAERTRLNEEAALADSLANQLSDVQTRRTNAQAIFKGVLLGGEDTVIPTDAYSRKLAGAIKEGTIKDTSELENVVTLGVDNKTLEAELNKLRILRLQELGGTAARELPAKQPGQVMDPGILGRTAMRMGLDKPVGTPGSVAKPPVPENAAQVQKQVDLTASAKGTKAVTVLDKGSPLPARVDPKLDVQQVGGRIGISNPKQIHADTAAKIISENVVNPVPLGQSTKAEIIPAGNKVVATSTPDVKDVVTQVVDSPASEKAAIAAQQKAVPGGITEVKTPEAVVAERLSPAFDAAEAARVKSELDAKRAALEQLAMAGRMDSPEAVQLKAELQAAQDAEAVARAREVGKGPGVPALVPTAPSPGGSTATGTLAKAPRAKKAKSAPTQEPAAKLTAEQLNTLIEGDLSGTLPDAMRGIMDPAKPDSYVQIPVGHRLYMKPKSFGVRMLGTNHGDVGLLAHPEAGNIYFNPKKTTEQAVVAKINSDLPPEVRHSGIPPRVIQTGFEAVDKILNPLFRRLTSDVHADLRALPDARGAMAADAHERAETYARTRYAADHIDYVNAFKGLTPQEKTLINRFMFDMKENGFSAIKLPVKLANRVDDIRTVLQRQLYDRYVADGPYIDGRLPNMDINYVPETLSKGAIEVMNAGDTPAYRAMEQDFVAHKVKMGASHDEAQAMWNTMVKAYSRAAAISEPTYNAVRQIEGTGLPASMRAPLEEALFKHAALTHRDVAWFKEFQQNRDVAQFLGLTDDGKGGTIELNNPSPEPVAKVFMANASGWRNANKTWLDAVGRLASAGKLGTVTGIKDFFMSVPNLSAYLELKDLPKVAAAFQRTMTTGTEAAIRAGAINPDRVQAQDIDNLTPGTKGMEIVERLADVLRKYQGRELLEAKGRQMAFELGRIVGVDKLSDTAWLNRLFGGNNDWRTMKREELLDAIGRKFVEKAQGNYGMSGLPGWMLDNTASPFARLFFKLGRYQVERFNNWYKDAWTPAVKGETYAPFLKSIMGGLISAAALNELLAAAGIKPNALVPSELAKSKNKELAYTVFSYLDTAGTIGLLGNLGYSAMQLANKELPRTFAVSLALQSMYTAGARLIQFGHALSEGAESGEAIAKLAGTVARDNIQLYREVAKHFEDQNMGREERIYKRQTGQNALTLSQMLDNPFDPTERMRNATTLEEAQAALPSIARKMQATGVVPVIRSPLRSLEINPLRPDRPNFYQWLEATKGLDVAEAQGRKDLAGDELTQDKNALIGVARNDLIRRAADLQRLRRMQQVMEP